MELASDATLVLTRALQQSRSGGVTVDVASVIEVAQQADDHVALLQRENEALRQQNQQLRDYVETLQIAGDKLDAWARWAEAELKRRPAAD